MFVGSRSTTRVTDVLCRYAVSIATAYFLMRHQTPRPLPATTVRQVRSHVLIIVVRFYVLLYTLAFDSPCELYSSLFRTP